MSTRCPWSRSWWPPRRSSASRSPTTRCRTSRPSATPCPTSRRTTEMSNVDVVVTGLGATTPLGGDVASTWDALLAGRSGVSPLTQEGAAQLTVRIAAQLAVDPSEIIDRVRLRKLDRSEAIALIAAKQAWADAGLAGSGLD